RAGRLSLHRCGAEAGVIGSSRQGRGSSEQGGRAFPPLLVRSVVDEVEDDRMAKAPAHVLKTFREYPQLMRLPLDPMHGWRSSPDEGGHTHCAFCGHTVQRGDPVVGCYLD